MLEPKRSMTEIMRDLKHYNDIHEKSLSYGKYVQMLERQEQAKSEQGKRKKVKAGNDKSRKEKNIKRLCSN